MPDALDDALAVWSATHPGQERDALSAALAQVARQGVTVSHPAGFFATWPYERRAAIRVARAEPSPCPDCHGEGWIYDDPTDPLGVRKCLHPNRSAVA